MESLSDGLVNFSSHENIGEIFTNNRWFKPLAYDAGDFMKKLLIGFLVLSSISAFSADVEQLIIKPEFSRGKLFHNGSSKDAVCKHLGYDKAKKDSAMGMWTSPTRDTVIELDNSGSILSETTGTFASILSITCVNPLNEKEEVLFENPVHPILKMPYSALSSDRGICTSLGYSSYVSNSQKNDDIDSSNKKKPLVVDNFGNVVMVDSPIRHRVTTEIKCK